MVIGVDEVGRGAFAGAVVAGAVSLARGDLAKLDWENIGIDDSKKLTPRKREELAKIIKKNALAIGIGEVGVAYINKYGIAKATAKAIRAALRQAQGKLASSSKIFVLVDAFHVKYLAGVGLRNQKAIVHGDQRSISIAAASIVAKVYRDRSMVKLSRGEYRRYKWHINKGYGTGGHIAAIRRHGPTKLHRRLFLRKLQKSGWGQWPSETDQQGRRSSR